MGFLPLGIGGGAASLLFEREIQDRCECHLMSNTRTN